MVSGPRMSLKNSFHMERSAAFMDWWYKDSPPAAFLAHMNQGFKDFSQPDRLI